MKPSSRPWRRLQSFIGLLGFIVCLAAVLYFTLAPNLHRTLFNVLPTPLRNLFGYHDDIGNILAFFVCGFVTFRVGHGRHSDGAACRSFLKSDRFRLLMLFALICGIELAQSMIPGRHSDLRDVVTGGAGVLMAFGLHRIWS